MPKMTIGEFLATQRKAKGYTQQQIAERLGISNRTLSSWEQGRAYPDILTLPALAEIYGVSVDEILRGERVREGDDVIAEELSEKTQKKLLKNSLARYKMKCSTVAYTAICGPVLLGLSFILFAVAPDWLTIICWILVAASYIVSAVLFAAFEKSALIVDSENARYTLAVRRTTAHYVALTGLWWLIFAVGATIIGLNIIFAGVYSFVQYVITGGIFAVAVILPAAALFISSTIIGGKESEQFTAEESLLFSKNKKLKRILISVCLGFILVLEAVAVGITINPIAIDDELYSAPADEFIRHYQTVYFTPEEAELYGVQTAADGGYFIDVEAAYAKEPEGDYYYHIEGNLYLASDGLQWKDRWGEYDSNYYVGCTVCYKYYFTGDDGKSGYIFQDILYGKKIMVGGYYELIIEYPDGGYDAIERGKVVFDFVNANEVSHTLFIFGFGLTGDEEYLIRDDNGVYTYVYRTSCNYLPFAQLLVNISAVIAAGTCALIYYRKRKKIVVDI